MTQEQFEALGIEKSLAKKAADESKKELEGYVPKADYDTMEQQKKQLETTVGDYKTQMESLKTAAGDNADLKQQIADLQEQNANKDKDHKKELDDLKVTNAIKMAISASAQDSDLVAGLMDRSKLILCEDGKVTGLDEQIKSLKESKPFLFKQEESKPAQKKGFFPLKPKEQGGQSKEDGHVSMKDAIAARLNLNEGKGE